MTTCALCGYSFSPDEGQSACAACPLHRKCALVRCPNCGYEFPPEKERSNERKRARNNKKARKAERKQHYVT
jgi:rubredoxin